MATSPSHKFGQIIGDMLEAALEPRLAEFAQKHKLYLDKKGTRSARTGKKVSWKDLNGNIHDLDFVLERNGSDSSIGTPVAFIEVAWRRYTKHSRNKAQEIQSAILPLVLTHRLSSPFIGVILAGVFTQGAFDQLKSLGFSILHFPYTTMMEAFSCVGIDAAFDEDTPDSELKKKIRIWVKLSKKQRTLPPKRLLELNEKEINLFFNALDKCISRGIELVRVFPLHGIAQEMGSIDAAIRFVQEYNDVSGAKPVVRYEIQIRYNNGDQIQAQFSDKPGAIDFLRSYLPLPLNPA